MLKLPKKASAALVKIAARDQGRYSMHAANLALAPVGDEAAPGWIPLDTLAPSVARIEPAAQLAATDGRILAVIPIESIDAAELPESIPNPQDAPGLVPVEALRDATAKRSNAQPWGFLSANGTAIARSQGRHGLPIPDPASPTSEHVRPEGEFPRHSAVLSKPSPEALSVGLNASFLRKILDCIGAGGTDAVVRLWIEPGGHKPVRIEATGSCDAPGAVGVIMPVTLEGGA